MKTNQIKLMYREAAGRLHDAEILDTRIHTKSDAAYLLKLLALEILLKTAALIYCDDFNRDHSYQALYKSLSGEVQTRLINRANYWAEVSLDDKALEEKLGIFEYNFIQLRYPYEVYKNMTEEELLDYGKLWVELGAPVDEAEFQYFPEELYGIIKALREEVDRYLDNN